MAVALEIRQVWGEALLDVRQFVDDDVVIGMGAGDHWRFLGVDMGFVPRPVGAALAWLLPGWSDVDRTFSSTFVAPLPEGEDWTLSRVEDGERVLRLAPGMSARATLGDRELDAEGLLAEGRARRDPDGTVVIAMTSDLAVTVDAAGQAFEARLAPRFAPIPARPQVDPELLGAGACVAILLSVLAIASTAVGSGPITTLRGGDDEPHTVVLDAGWNRPAPGPVTRDTGSPKGPEGAAPKRARPSARSSDRPTARQAGLLSFDGLDRLLGTSDLPGAVASAIGGITGFGGTEIGGSGLGRRGGGLGGGGEAEGFDGVVGPALGEGYGGEGGDLDGKREGGLGLVGGQALVIGGMDRSLIDEVVKRHLNEIRYCYQRELVRDPSLEGKVVMKFTIGADGSVSSAGVKSATLQSPAVQECLTKRFLRLRFPEPRGGGLVVVSYPFVFGRG